MPGVAVRGDELEESGVGEPRTSASLEDVVVDLAPLQHRVVGERVDDGVDRIRLVRSPARIASISPLDAAESCEDRRVERHAIGVVDSDTDGDAGDLSVHGRGNVGVGDRAAEGVERREQSGAGPAETAARLGTKPRSAAIASRTGRDAGGGGGLE